MAPLKSNKDRTTTTSSQQKGPYSKKALLHAELSRERCAELVLLLGFVIVAAFMMTVVLLLLLFVFLAGGVLQKLLALTPLRAVTFLSALLLMRARPCRACHRVVPLPRVRHRSPRIGSTHRIPTHRLAAHRVGLQHASARFGSHASDCTIAVLRIGSLRIVLR